MNQVRSPRLSVLVAGMARRELFVWLVVIAGLTLMAMIAWAWSE